MKLFTPDPRPNGKRWFCGPFAFSAITGKNFEETRSILNYQMGRLSHTGIMGLHEDTLIAALSNYNLMAQPRYVKHSEYQEHMTLNKWLRSISRADDNVYLVVITGHFVVTQGRSWLMDNHTGHPVSAMTAPWQNKRVKKVFKITKIYK